MQTDILQKAGINPSTLLSNVLYWQKLERGLSTILYLPYVVLILVSVLSQKTNSSTQSPSWALWLIVLAFSGLVVGALYSIWIVYLVPKIYKWRVRVFATKNNLSVQPQNKLLELVPDSLISSDRHNIQAIGCALSVSKQSITVFDYSCVIGSGKYQEYLSKGLAVIQLQKNYPHLFLDSKKNGRNHKYDASQKVQLEGEFSKYFDVYMPEGSQAGSLTVFAPDMMQTILNTGKLFDVEIKGNVAVVISDEPVFTGRVLPSILNCADGLSKEFIQLDRTWKPVFAPGRKEFILKGQPAWRLILIGLAPFILAMGFNLLPENIKHPIKNQPAPVAAPLQDNDYSRDYNTLTSAYKIAQQLNYYTAKSPVPETLAQAHILSSPISITYTKLLPDTYKFCTTYHSYINGNGPTRASGNIIAYYGATVDSPNLPSTLQIVEWHQEGKNCQIVRPLPPTGQQ